MTARALSLFDLAMELPAAERLDLAAELLASTEPEPPESAEVQQAWAHEIERRAERVLAGDSAGTPWEEIRDSLRTRLLAR